MNNQSSYSAVLRALEPLYLNTGESSCVVQLLNFFHQNPQKLGWRGKTKPNPRNLDGQVLISQRFIATRRTKIIPSVPKTVPDEMVSVILRSFYEYSSDESEKTKVSHLHSMAAEGATGALLEAYISSVGEKYGWIQCVGSLVKSVDFIKLTSNGWIELQVKNRDNSENSSSKAIRDGTMILHWFRTYAKTGKTNWDAFPDDELRSLLNEDDFIAFVVNYLVELKSLNCDPSKQQSLF